MAHSHWDRGRDARAGSTRRASRGLTDYAETWGIAGPPWVFVIDRDGRLHAKFTSIIGSDELRAAITSVTPWHPVAWLTASCAWERRA
jgi:hypothetical protein